MSKVTISDVINLLTQIKSDLDDEQDFIIITRIDYALDMLENMRLNSVKIKSDDLLVILGTVVESLPAIIEAIQQIIGR